MRKRAQEKSITRKIKKKTLGIILIFFFIIVITLILVNLDIDDYREVYSSQLPDIDSTGIGVCMKGDISYSSFADDFFWNDSTLATEINLWGSFNMDLLPEEGVDGLTFQIIIHEDNNNKPGTILWEKIFYPDEYFVALYEESRHSWYCLRKEIFNRYNHKNIYQYDFFINEGIDFFQNITEIYWLEIKWIHEDINTEFGWKTTRYEDGWNENACSFNQGKWVPLTYPSGHEYQNKKINLAFAIC